MNSVEFRYLCGNTDHSGALEEAGVLEADAIIIGPADDLSDNEVCSLNYCCQQGWVLSALISALWSVVKVANDLPLHVSNSSQCDGQHSSHLSRCAVHHIETNFPHGETDRSQV